MKLLKLIILLVFINLNLLNAQQSRFKEGETIHVWATSGLNMRDKPDAKAKKVATIPYGAKVTVQANIGVKIPFEVEEFKGFVVKGYWLLVKYGNTEGFVFDGFLSWLPAPSEANHIEPDAEMESYFTEKIGKIGEKYDVKIWDEKKENRRELFANEKYNYNDLREYKQKYKHNIQYEYNAGEGGSDSKIVAQNITLYEGYFLLKHFFYDKDNYIITLNNDNKSIKLEPKEEGGGSCYYNVKLQGIKIEIVGYCGC